jgi:hypothetical protein
MVESKASTSRARDIFRDALTVWEVDGPRSCRGRVLRERPVREAFTVYLRAHLDMARATALLCWGGEEAGVRVFTRLAGTDPSLHSWDVQSQNYLAIASKTGMSLVLEAEITLDNADPARRRMRVGVPLAMIGSGRCLDIALRFTGPSLDLLVDGVLVDQEWPIGNAAVGRELVIGGDSEGEGDLRVETAATWDRALSDGELIELAGGGEAVARREIEILGPQSKQLQYFTPRGHNAWAGDTMCFFHDGVFHLLYLTDRRHGHSKFGAGAHQIAHCTSSDLVTWVHHPLAAGIEEQYQTFGTGTMVFRDGRYYLFYGLHSDRCRPEAGTRYRELRQLMATRGEVEARPFDALGGIPMGTTYSSSDDGIHFSPSRRWLHPSQNPSVFADEAGKQLVMLAGYGSSGVYTSGDGCRWEKGKDVIPFAGKSELWNSDECQCHFEWNGWHYIVAGRTGFFMSRSMAGPYQSIIPAGTADTCRPRWDIYDGLWVPMVAPFKDNRRILAGWLQYEAPWAGTLVFRELIQHEDGTLGMKWPAEMVPGRGDDLPLRLHTGVGVTGNETSVEVASNAFALACLEGLRADIRLTLDVTPSPGTEAFGVNLVGHGEYEGGCELQFLPKLKQVQWGVPQGGIPASRIPRFDEIVTQDARVNIWDENVAHTRFANMPFKGGNFALANVEGLDRPFTLELIIKAEKNGGVIIDACIDNRRTMITFRRKLTGDRLFLFARHGSVRFTQIRASAIPTSL